MGKATALPKNIRQIGEIEGNERICLEDYVMTYIHKKEPQEKEGFLGIFYGEQQEAEDGTYLFVRGILELPVSEETEKEKLLEELEGRRKEYFPDWTVQGCCVIGQYPTEQMKLVEELLPEAMQLIYHLQEQEEHLYRTTDGRYRRLKGYIIFYEQNRKMQQYLADQFKENSVEKESLPDKAIKSFREKVRMKSEKRSSSMLRLASSFFVVTVLVIGAIVVTRIDDIRKVQTAVSRDGNTQENEAENAGQIYMRSTRSTAGSQGAAENDVAAASGNASDASQPDGSVADAGLTANTGVANLQGGNGTASGLLVTGEGTAATSGNTSQDGTAAASSGNASQPDTSAVSNGNASQSDASAVSGGNASQPDASAVSSGNASQSDASAVSSGNASQSDASAASSGIAAQDGLSASSTGTGSQDDLLAASTGTGSQADLLAASSGTESQGGLSTGSQADLSAASSETVSQADGSAGMQLANDLDIPAAPSQPADASASDAATTPGADTEAAAASSSSARRTRASYTIREGDTLADICNKYYGSLDKLSAICELNSIDDANLIMPGQKIELP